MVWRAREEGRKGGREWLVTRTTKLKGVEKRWLGKKVIESKPFIRLKTKSE